MIAYKQDRATQECDPSGFVSVAIPIEGTAARIC